LSQLRNPGRNTDDCPLVNQLKQSTNRSGSRSKGLFNNVR